MTEPKGLAWLCLRIELHEPRFHGTPEWPPSPARAFQALVSAAGRGRPIEGRHTAALQWLEGLAPPRIGCPRARHGRAAQHYVPNNDIDAVGGVPHKVEKIRVLKPAEVRLLDDGIPFYYVWKVKDSGEHADSMATIASYLHQFGRGVDTAHASFSTLAPDALEDLIGHYRGEWFEPGAGRGSVGLKCPTPGSLARLVERFEASLSRLETIREKKKRKQFFAQPPMVQFPEVRYGGGLDVVSYDLVPVAGGTGQLTPWPLRRAHDLVTRLRDGVFEALRKTLGEQHLEALSRTIIGRGEEGGAAHVAVEERIQLIPLPSTGHEHVSPQIRRVLLAFPQESEIANEDLQWALERCEVGEKELSCVVPSEDASMSERYLRAATRWQSSTPLALSATRRRLGSAQSDVKASGERRFEENAAISAVHEALRHGGVHERVLDVCVQREPFGKKGARADTFAEGTRFRKESLWHVALSFANPVAGPLVLGNGRFLGLGVMHPAERTHPRLLALRVVEGLKMRAPEGAWVVANALRRAVMSRVQREVGRRSLRARVSGHQADGRPSTDPHKLAYTCDLERNLLVIASTAPAHDRDADDVFAQLDRALNGFRTLRAAQAGTLRLKPALLSPDDPLVRPSRVWSSLTPYEVDRHRPLRDAREAVKRDVEEACDRGGWPRPSVKVVRLYHGESRGLSAFVRMRFETAVEGPLYLGRSRYKGGGLFSGLDDSSL